MSKGGSTRRPQMPDGGMPLPTMMQGQPRPFDDLNRPMPNINFPVSGGGPQTSLIPLNTTLTDYDANESAGRGVVGPMRGGGMPIVEDPGISNPPEVIRDEMMPVRPPYFREPLSMPRPIPPFMRPPRQMPPSLPFARDMARFRYAPQMRQEEQSLFPNQSGIASLMGQSYGRSMSRPNYQPMRQPPMRRPIMPRPPSRGKGGGYRPMPRPPSRGKGGGFPSIRTMR